MSAPVTAEAPDTAALGLLEAMKKALPPEVLAAVEPDFPPSIDAALIEAVQLRFCYLLEDGRTPAQAAAAIVADLPLDEGHASALALIGLDYVTGCVFGRRSQQDA